MWNAEETHKHVERLYGWGQLQLARPSLRSVVDRLEYARFHYHEAKDAFEALAAKHAETMTLVEVMSRGDESTADLEEHQMRIGAHVLAVVQCLHAVPDILAHAIYYCLALNQSPKPLKEVAINVSSVAAALGDLPDGANVQRLLTELTGAGQASHIAALANHGKHRSIVRTGIAEDWTGKAPQRFELRFAEFTYRGTIFPHTAAMKLLADEFDRCGPLVMDIGNALNGTLSDRT